MRVPFDDVDLGVKGRDVGGRVHPNRAAHAHEVKEQIEDGLALGAFHELRSPVLEARKSVVIENEKTRNAIGTGVQDGVEEGRTSFRQARPGEGGQLGRPKVGLRVEKRIECRDEMGAPARSSLGFLVSPAAEPVPGSEDMGGREG
jgi:hypothetical protein